MVLVPSPVLAKRRERGCWNSVRLDNEVDGKQEYDRCDLGSWNRFWGWWWPLANWAHSSIICPFKKKIFTLILYLI